MKMRDTLGTAIAVTATLLVVSAPFLLCSCRRGDIDESRLATLSLIKLAELEDLTTYMCFDSDRQRVYIGRRGFSEGDKVLVYRGEQPIVATVIHAHATPRIGNGIQPRFIFGVVNKQADALSPEADLAYLHEELSHAWRKAVAERMLDELGVVPESELDLGCGSYQTSN